VSAPLAHFLRNRFYIGEVVFKGEVFPGEQPAILDRDLFDAVQAKLNEQRNNHTVARSESESLLIGRIYDEPRSRVVLIRFFRFPKRAAARLALCLRPVARPAQNEEPKCAGSEARRRGRLPQFAFNQFTFMS
jgi:Recombinase